MAVTCPECESVIGGQRMEAKGYLDVVEGWQFSELTCPECDHSWEPED